MRKLIFTLLMIFTSAWLQAQPCFWNENFDGTISTISGGTPGWATDNTVFLSAANSMRGQYNSGGTTLTTQSMDFTGLNFIKLKFDQICKIEFVDTGYVEVSVNGGPFVVINTLNSIYLGNSGFNQMFNEATYFDWLPGQVVTPTNAWWKNEIFDVSALCGGQSDVRFRFEIVDGLGFNGMAARSGWYLDNLCVEASPCETDPNTFDFSAYPYWAGNLYTPQSSYDVFVDLIDPSGIQSAELFWTISSDPVPGTVNQFGGMVDFGTTPSGPWAGTITSTVNVDDTVCWWIESIDNSGCGNIARWPATGCIQFILKGGITYPYCDDFDLQNPPFTDSIGATAVGPDHWELGNPTWTTAHSGTNVWGIGNDGQYDNEAEVYLISPTHDFTGITAANLSFWQNYDTENFWDGVRMEYSTDGGVNWQLLGTGSSTAPDPYGTNWYVDDQLNSSSLNAWCGNSGGWINSKYKLGFAPGLMGSSNIKFRYVFTSDFSVTGTGYAIDDWCIILPDSIDVGVPSIISPLCGSGLPEGDSITVQVNIENFGLNTLSGFDVFYSINNNPPVATPFPGTLPANTVTPLSLTPGVVPSGAFTVCVWTDYTGDNIATNDTICCTFSGIPTLTPTYCDDFESGNIGWYATVDPAANQNTIWELGFPNSGGTTGAHSGTNAWDINLNTPYTNEANASLYSPYFDVSAITSGSIEFWFNFETENFWDGVRLEYTLDNGSTWQVLGSGPPNGQTFPASVGADPCGTSWYNNNSLNSSGLPGWCGSSGGWVKSGYKLCCANNLFQNPIPIQFRYTFTSDFSIQVDGFSIDDFCFYNITGDDVGISAILSPSGGVPAGSPQAVVVTLENFGATTVTSTQITYTINNGTPVTFAWTGSLPPCGTVTVTLPTSVFVQGVNDIVAWTSLGTDTNTSNDSSSTSVVGQPLITPTYSNVYCDDFENGNVGWAPSALPGTNDAWELGLPNFGNTTGAHSGTNAWDINLQTAVNDNGTVILTTPYFDLTNAFQASIRFWQNRSITAFGDEFYIEYQVDNSGNWQRLGSSTTPGTTNWYNSGTGTSWDAVSAGWVYCEYKNINAEVGSDTVQFRFVLEAGFGGRDGVSIDDFCLFVPIPLSVKPVAVNTSVPNQLIFPGLPFQFSSPVANNGINTVFNHNITLTIDTITNIVAQAPVTYIPNGLAPDDTMLFTFNTTWIAVPGIHQVCVYTDSPNGAPDLYLPDDTICTYIHVFDSITTTQLPYCNSFESAPEWVSVNAISYVPNSIWEVGGPSQVFINNAHTGARAWTTLLNADYRNADSSGLFSSVIRVQTNHCYRMSFWEKFRMEFGSDGGAVEYSTDYGVTWNPIDYTGTPNVVMFGANTNYTYVSTLDPINPAARGFTGYQNDWMYTEKTLRPNVDGQMIIRFRFASDYSTRDEGWAIDDFCFTDLGLCTPLGLNDVVAGNFGISQNYPNPANGLTSFEYVIPEQGQVTLTVYNMMGQEVAVLENGSRSEGIHKIDFDANSLVPGIYMYTLRFNDQQMTKRMIITR